VLGDLKPVEEILRQSTLATEKDLLMTHAAHELSLVGVVCLAVVDHEDPAMAWLGSFVRELHHEHIGKLC
jgi:hypothetical protein